MEDKELCKTCSGLTIEVATMREQNKYIIQKLDENSVEHKEIYQLIKEWTEQADRKYASKLSEIIVYGMVGMVLTLVFGALIYEVVKH